MLEFEAEFNHDARIKVIGVGGGGSNAVDHMADVGLPGIDLIAVNTDAQALSRSHAPQKIQIGAKLTKGLGSGANPQVGREAALEDRERIAQALRGANLVFITAGLGGGTGTGASQVIADIAREMGALTVSVVTKPFLFEGRKRSLQAEYGLKELNDKVNTLLCIPNQKLFSLVEKEISFLDAFKKADDMLLEGIKSISDLITIPGLINLDLADVRTVIAENGEAFLGVGFGKGANRAKKAVRGAVSCPLLEQADIKGARGVLINVSGGPDLSLQEVEEVTMAVYEMADSNANIIFGAAFDESLKGQLKVTVLATGLRSAEEEQLNLKLDNFSSLHAVEMLATEKGGFLERKRKKRGIFADGFVEDSSRQEDILDIPTFIRWGK